MLVNRGGYATQPRAPGHDRPRTALRAARHGRLSAAATAPGADVPRTTTVRAPGQYCLSAAHWAPGHGRPLASTAGVPVHDRLSAVFLAPGPDAPRASTAPVSGQDRLRATRIATAPRLAGQSRRRQGSLPRVPATPNTLTYPLAHRLNRHSRRPTRHSRASGNPRPLTGVGKRVAPAKTGAVGARHAVPLPWVPSAWAPSSNQSLPLSDPRPPVATGGPPGRYAPATGSAGTRTPRYAPAHFTIHHVQPALQVPPGPQCCSTAAMGTRRQHPSRAPPPQRRA